MRDHFATLAEALVTGIHEEPLWRSFLDELVLATKASLATLSFHPPGWSHGDGLLLGSTGVPPEGMRENQRRNRYPDNELLRVRMKEGLVYSLADIKHWDLAANRGFFQESAQLGITDARQMRVREAGGVDAWLSVVRLGGRFAGGAVGVLERLAPLLRGVLHTYVLREQDRFTTSMAEDTARRLRVGWIALDGAGRIAGADAYGEQVLATSGVVARDWQGKLEARLPDVQRELEAALAKLAADPTATPRAIPLRGDPWLDMLLVRARQKPLAATGAAEVIAYVHGDNWSSSDRQAQLSQLFSLSAREAELALALCRGKSIAEAAGEIGLTVETARSYSKAIYAKVGARGQPDLVRIIMGSVLALAPEG